MNFKSFFLIFSVFSFPSNGEERGPASFVSAKEVLIRALDEDTYFFHFNLGNVYDFFKPFSQDFVHFHTWSHERQIEILQLWFLVCLRHPNIRLQMTFKSISEKSWSHFKVFFTKWFQSSFFDSGLDPNLQLSLWEETILIGNAAQRRKSEMAKYFLDGGKLKLKIGGGSLLKRTSFCRDSGASIFGPYIQLNMEQEDFLELFLEALEDFNLEEHPLFQRMIRVKAEKKHPYFDRLITQDTPPAQQELIRQCSRVWSFVLDLFDVTALFNRRRNLFQGDAKEIADYLLCPIKS